MTILVDCTTQLTKRLDRSVTARVATEGLILMGVQLVETESFFVGDLQQLLFADTPDEAYNLCTKYSPGCSGSAGHSSGGSITGSGFVSGGHVVSSSSEITRSSSGGSSASSGSSFRTSSSVSGGGGSSSSESSRYEANASRAGSIISGGRQVNSAQISRGSSHGLGQSGAVTTTGQVGSRGQLSEIREDIYGTSIIARVFVVATGANYEYFPQMIMSTVMRTSCLRKTRPQVELRNRTLNRMSPPSEEDHRLENHQRPFQTRPLALQRRSTLSLPDTVLLGVIPARQAFLVSQGQKEMRVAMDYQVKQFIMSFLKS